MSKKDFRKWIAIMAVFILGVISISLIVGYEDNFPASFNGYQRAQNAQVVSE